MWVSTHSMHTSTRDTHQLVFTANSFLALYMICKVSPKFGNALMNVRNDSARVLDIMVNIGNNGARVFDIIADVGNNGMRGIDGGVGIHNLDMCVDCKLGLEADP